ncbi:MAG: hypothetical protein BWK73_20000 [Thiothrix lacustris]|uniref:Uncharacterized protein n=1 Tax=Thiothrix lacustris TaxID=525917 RepID=A0A1Y1QPG6_9GAMM|nr:MAG: hypothetical protein BWK73_20000 [Thiothrix lacustris]
MQTFIPFSGFYESWHNDLLDQELEQLNQDRDTGEALPEDHPEYIKIDDVRCGAVHQQYAREYCSSLQWFIKENEPLDVQFTFSHLWSPKFYNYDTDVIWVDMPDDQIVKLYQHAMQYNRFAAVVKQRCGGRSSFFSPDLTEWADSPLEWQPAQVSLLFEALDCLDTYNRDYPLELVVMDSARGNGKITDMILSNVKQEVAA